ncbi:STY4851/ECs_5259 family protein [Atlantibacter subterraneus]|uniref:STY4851/ECs_5259 family protein n=1 Tax=Atlantibacter subterraneus TaxID=255519 RepID=UPI0026851A10|nr:STY4851/ECs_5259 family protein [Atlantibacter subterranea]
MSHSDLITTFKCTSWLNKFLNRRGLKQPDHRPLYEYHATKEEYDELKRLLRAVGQQEMLKRDQGYAACFTLYCSEWYRRDYERECGWAWEPVFKSLGISFTSAELRNIVPKGMEDYWLRPIRFYESERRNFLGTLFSEGGLPFRLLKESDSHFQTVFSRILNQYGQAQLAGFSILSLVRTVIEKSALPIVFSEDTSVALISHIAEKLSSLVLMYNLNNYTEPVKQLNIVHPKWRDEFPMPLDDETGTHFLNGLLCTASVETKSRLQKNKGSGCQFYWLENYPHQIQAIISLPDEISFPIISEPSTTRFELAIYEDGEEIASLGPAYASLENAYAKVRLRKNESRFIRRQPTVSLSIVARTGGMIVGSIKLEDSEIAVGEVPLTFVDDKERWLLQGQASCSVRNSNVLIALPKEETTISGYAGIPDTVSLLGLKTLSVYGRQDVTISGNEIYRIRTGREQSNLGMFDFNGKRVLWNCYPDETFLGVPKVTAQKLDIEDIQFKYYLNGISLDECQIQEMMGTQYVSVRNTHNETLLRRKIGILPADFNIEIKSGDLANEGSIVISTQHPCMSVLKDKTLQVARKRSAGQTDLPPGLDTTFS